MHNCDVLTNNEGNIRSVLFLNVSLRKYVTVDCQSQDQINIHIWKYNIMLILTKMVVPTFLCKQMWLRERFAETCLFLKGPYESIFLETDWTEGILVFLMNQFFQ